MAQCVYLAITSSRIKLEIWDLDQSISYSLANIMFIFNIFVTKNQYLAYISENYSHLTAHYYFLSAHKTQK